jgi:hypothetical protein
MAGLYLAISPWVVGFQALTPLVVVNVLTGLVLVALALGLAAAYERLHGLTWVLPLIGGWTFVAPWVIRGGEFNTTPAVTSNVTLGSICIVAGVASMLIAIGRLSR